MNQWRDRVLRFVRADDGPTAVEYALMLMLVLLACLTAVVSYGQATRASFQRSAETIDASLAP